MATHPATKLEDPGVRAALAAFQKMDLVCSFGPSFFLGQLGEFVRERCPLPQEELPVVEVTLVDGETLDVCHIEAVSPRWVVFAVPEAARSKTMATEFVPYELVRRVRIRSRNPKDVAMGFAQSSPPDVVTESSEGRLP